MSFNSLQFMVFFPVVVLIFFLIPQRIRYIWLLISSYYFYMSWNPKYALLMVISTIITYLSGILINESEKKILKKIWVSLSFLSNLGILVYFKYFDFVLDNLNTILSKIGIAILENPYDVVLPVGISFYTFQALSYTMDVYREELKPERNFFKYALFVSFFPQLVAGPIERSTSLLSQINDVHYFDTKRVKRGLALMLWGLFMKLVLADRLAIIVDSVFDDYQKYSGFYIVFAVILFAFQIYCDFGSYSNIAIGAAEVMGFELMKNFEQPYLATSVTSFWKRWHISLTSWFRDYLYIPLGGNRKGKIRKYINILLVFSISGLWHGASWHFVIWGIINGIYQVIEDVFKPIKNKLLTKFNTNTSLLSYKLRKIITTFILVDFSWLFFRAPSLGVAIQMIRSLFDYNPWIIFDGRLLNLGLDAKDLGVLIVGLIILFFVDIVHEKCIDIRMFVSEQEIWFRWLFYIVAIVFILIFGVYGPSYKASDFIYFQF